MGYWPAIPAMNHLSLFLPCAAGVEDFLAQEVHGLTGLAGDDLLIRAAACACAPTGAMPCSSTCTAGWRSAC